MENENNPNTTVQENNVSVASDTYVLTSSEKFFAALSYLGILVLVSHFFSGESKFVRYHIRQSLVIISVEIIVFLLSSLFPFMDTVYQIIHLFDIVMVILGIVNSTNGVTKPLPIYGSYSSYFPE